MRGEKSSPAREIPREESARVRSAAPIRDRGACSVAPSPSHTGEQTGVRHACCLWTYVRQGRAAVAREGERRHPGLYQQKHREAPL
jgi:hypothetical protein